MEDENVADLVSSLFAAPSAIDDDIKDGGMEDEEEEFEPKTNGTRFDPLKYKPIFDGKANLQKKGTRPIPVLRPNLKEMQNFPAYIESIERKGMHLESGIVKIIPPAGWHSKAKPHFKYDNLDQLEIKRCLSGQIKRVESEGDGVYHLHNIVKTFNKNGITLGEFMQKATDPNAQPKRCKKLDDVVENFWKSIGNPHNKACLYGADVEGTLFKDEIQEFNPNKLETLMDLAKESGMQIPGITSPYLYFGSYRTAFAWHTEDLDLYSLNYQHFGEPKIWYSLPSAASGRFERLCAQLYKKFGIACHSFMRHKICLTRPDILEKHRIPYGCIAQHPGEFILTFPRGYHQGFNVGFNCNEAINFGTNRWFAYGLQAKICDCNPEMSVRMNLTSILKKYAEEEEHREFFIREPVKGTERNRPALGMRDSVQDALPTLKRLLIFDSNFEEEKKYNEEQAEISPFCCVCQYFTPQTNCQLKGPIKGNSKSPCYISPLMLNKTQCSSIGPYRPDRTNNIPYLPFAESPLRQCVNCKIAVHANCYSFIEGLPKEKSKFMAKQKPPEIQRVAKAEPKPTTMEVKPKSIRINVSKRVISDSNIEKEQSLSPVPTTTNNPSTSSSSIPTTTTPPPRRLILKAKGPSTTLTPVIKQENSAPINNIFKKIMKRVKVADSKSTETPPPPPKTVISLKIKEEPKDAEANQLLDQLLNQQQKEDVVVIKPILSKNEVFENELDQSQHSTTLFQQNPDEWLCDPCRLMFEDEERRKYVCCEFCSLRGGALIQRKLPDLYENSFVHVVCAIISRWTSMERNSYDELIAHSLPPLREYSALKKTQKNLLSTTDNRVRLCSTYSNHDKALFSGNFEDNFCGLCKEALHDVLVKCEKCHLEARKMDVYHPTCAHILGFQFCARFYPEIAVAICPAHFDMSNDPKLNVKVGDIVVHKTSDEELKLAEVVFIGSTTSEIIMSFQGGFSEIDKQQVLMCECKTMGCNGQHFPGYLAAIRNRGAIGVTLGVFRGRHIERTYRLKYDDGVAISAKRQDIFIHKDSNCPAEAKKMLMKRRAERECLELMNVPIKRERRTTNSEPIPAFLLVDPEARRGNGERISENGGEAQENGKEVQENEVHENGKIQVKQEQLDELHGSIVQE